MSKPDLGIFERLSSALKDNKIEEFKKFVDEFKIDVNQKDSKGQTLLMKAVEAGNSELVDFFVEKKAKINVEDEKGTFALKIAKDKAEQDKGQKQNYDNIFHSLSQYALIEAVQKDTNYKDVEKLVKVGANAGLVSGLIIVAVKMQNYKMVEMLIKGKADVNYKNRSGDRVIVSAAENNNDEIVKILVDAKADVNLPNGADELAIIAAMKNKKYVTAQILINAGANLDLKNSKGESALQIAVRNKAEKVIPMLLEAGAKIDNLDAKQLEMEIEPDVKIKDLQDSSHKLLNMLKSIPKIPGQEAKYQQETLRVVADFILGLSVKHTKYLPSILNVDGMEDFKEHEELFKILSGKSDGSQSSYSGNLLEYKLIKAVATHKHQEVDQLLKAGARADKVGELIIYAAYMQDEIMIRKLIESKVNVDYKNSDGDYAIVYAAENPGPTILRMFIKAGANINLKNKFGQTAVSVAARHGNHIPLRILIEKGADVNQKDEKVGGYPITIAARKNDDEMIRLLIKAKANLENKDSSGDSAIIIAARNNNLTMVKMLAEAGANLNEKSGDGFSLIGLAEANHNFEMRGFLQEKQKIKKEQSESEDEKKAEEQKRMIEEKRKRAEEEKRKVEEEKRRAEEKRKTEEKKKKAEEEKRKIEESKKEEAKKALQIVYPKLVGRFSSTTVDKIKDIEKIVKIHPDPVKEFYDEKGRSIGSVMLIHLKTSDSKAIEALSELIPSLITKENLVKQDDNKRTPLHILMNKANEAGGKNRNKLIDIAINMIKETKLDVSLIKECLPKGASSGFRSAIDSRIESMQFDSPSSSSDLSKMDEETSTQIHVAKNVKNPVAIKFKTDNKSKTPE